MRRIILTILLMVFVTPVTRAGYGENDTLLLRFDGGAGYGIFRDMGASPLTYKGLEIHPGIGVEWRQANWLLDGSLHLSGGAYGILFRLQSLRVFGGQVDAGVELLHKVYSRSGLTLWAGGGVNDLFDLRYNSALNNSNVGMSNWVRLDGSARAEYTLGRWRFDARIGLDLLSLNMRPGFAYIDNYDHDISNPVNDAGTHYSWYVTGVPGVSTALGVRRLTKHGNEVGLSYAWHYITSRVSSDGLSAPHRFNQASHALMIHLLVPLK